jgi:hypothetical protein
MRVARTGSNQKGAVAGPHANRASVGEWLDATLLDVKGAELALDIGGEDVRVRVDGMPRLREALRSGRVPPLSTGAPTRLSAFYGVIAILERRSRHDLEQGVQSEVWLTASEYWVRNGPNSAYFGVLRSAIAATFTAWK